MKKIINNVLLLIGLFTLFCFTSCVSKNVTIKQNDKVISITDLKNGDLIFIRSREENLSGAINRVTQISKQRNYDHVGLVEKNYDSIFILHSAPEGGSQRESIRTLYLSATQNKRYIDVYRLKNEFSYSIPDAIINAKLMVGKPYNWTYILNNESFYCSDFIERAFRGNSIFQHIPMNFTNINTGQFDSFWIEFYQKLNLEIPQNQPGTNPNQLAESEKIVQIGTLYIN
ncbi:hypothetical protein IM532_03840 [Faecalibacter sp. WQ 117]|uniref:Permuted papain-like amidase enzyme, YaeF/YiiX, C92 family n=1 Tax=Faecalibacter rhinopitheci TaxID=2779678 RepID=A0A8J7FM44_9FLAO|nr:hypothetical protein [Faecalibacter rhinopitheci]